MSERLELKVAGHQEPILLVMAGVSSCGDIRDGVVFAHGTGHRWQGDWVLSFADLERVYLLAKALRAHSGEGG